MSVHISGTQIQGPQQTLLGTGPFILSRVKDGGNEEECIQAKVAFLSCCNFSVPVVNQVDRHAWVLCMRTDRDRAPDIRDIVLYIVHDVNMNLYHSRFLISWHTIMTYASFHPVARL